MDNEYVYIISIGSKEEGVSSALCKCESIHHLLLEIDRLNREQIPYTVYECEKMIEMTKKDVDG